MKGTLYLVNRAHPLPEEPAAEDLASVRSGQTEVRLHQRAKVMLDQLLAAVDGAGTIIPVSGYRPQTEQQAIWDDALAEHIRAAGAVGGENYWPLPLWKGYEDNLKSEVADICHMGPREGGAIHAALFLKHFVREGVRWAHLDIAGVDWATKKTALCPVGSTGFGARTLLELARGGV